LKLSCKREEKDMREEFFGDPDFADIGKERGLFGF